MKKNKMMRIASVLLIAVLMTTCVISGTFAKYVTTGTANDTARVAKWGVNIEGTVSGTDASKGTLNSAFVTSYNGVDPNASTVTVQSTVDVVAPGTSGTFSSFSVTGTPEVMVEVKYVATVDISDDWTSDGTTFYCPIAIKVGENVVTTSAKTAGEYERAVKEAIDALTATYAPGTNLTAVNDDISISWEWAFGTNDAGDTYLGNLATAPTISISIEATINQVD